MSGSIGLVGLIQGKVRFKVKKVGLGCVVKAKALLALDRVSEYITYRI